MRMLDYKMYTFEGSYTFRDHVRDSLGETTGQMVDALATFAVMVVARTYAMAELWIEQRYNASHQNRKDFDFRLINTQPAPHLLIEWTG